MKTTKKKINILNKTEITLTAAILILFVLFSLTTDSFFSEYNLTNLLKQSSIVGVLSIGAMSIVLTGGIDLSAGSLTGMGALIVAIMMTKFGLPIWVSVVIAILVCMGFGLYNGIIVQEFGVPPFVATLGTMHLVRGLIKIISDSKTVAGLPAAFNEFGNNSTLGISNLAWIWLVVVVCGFLMFRYTRFGRNIYVLGSGREIAKLSGINLRANTYGVYIFAGFLCGVAGVMLASRINSAVPTGGTGYEMSAVTACVIGGVSLSGAKGTVLGAVLGTILMQLINNGGIQLGINPFLMEATTGILITIAVIIDMLSNKKGK